ncbi:hypothetical protein [Lentibacillus sp. JNUCC-1]|uniref:hypothetical protein n=1 Tax=Lentibacillus sp. JNUCC-1 TaxID=2654513 RepID=UPI0018D233AF|nr:hypothetical protein [Lentibacillus sp. JNUCC-1]
MLKISSYIHLNPLESGLVRQAKEYRWSSYRHYVSKIKDPLISHDEILNCFTGLQSEKRLKYQEFVEAKGRVTIS